MAVPSDLQPLQHRDGVLPQDEVHVWHTDLNLSQAAVESLARLLNAEEHDRASRFKVSAPREQFVISRVFLRQALGLYLNTDARTLQFQTTSHGKPELAGGSDLRFNLSHTAGMAIVALARDRQVGVDVEKIREDIDTMELADRFFSAQEAEWVRSQPAAERFSSFFTCWTAKEAYIKAHGEGLSMPLDRFSLMPRPGASQLELQVFDDPEESKRWSVWQLELGANFRGALAAEGRHCKVLLGPWPPLKAP